MYHKNNLLISLIAEKLMRCLNRRYIVYTRCRYYIVLTFDQSSLFDLNMIICSKYLLYEFTKHDIYLLLLLKKTV